MPLYDFTFYDLICRNARIFKDQTAWYEVDDHKTLSFTEYADAVRRLAAGLQATGIRPGDRIGVLGKNSLEFILLYGAAAATGAIVLPINWRLSADEVCFNLNDGQPKLVFVDHEYQDMIDGRRTSLATVEDYVNLKSDKGRFRSFGELSNLSPQDFVPPELNRLRTRLG